MRRILRRQSGMILSEGKTRHERRLCFHGPARKSGTSLTVGFAEKKGLNIINLFKATPHNHRLTPLYIIRLHIFRHYYRVNLLTLFSLPLRKAK